MSELLNDNVDNSQRKHLVITGEAGIGKSEVCLAVAHLMREEFWGVFWVDVSTPSNAKNGFFTIGETAFGLFDLSIEEVLQMLANTPRRWLLILDSTDDPEFDYAAYIPSGNKGAMIMTSRLPECSRYSTLPVEVLNSLAEIHSMTLLLELARASERPSWNHYVYRQFDGRAQAIVQLLGSHTLAVLQAGTCIAKSHCQINEYAEKYKRMQIRLSKDCLKPQGIRHSSFHVTFEALAEELNNDKNETAQDALDLLGVLSMLHSSGLPLGIFRDTWKGAQYILEARDDEISGLGQWHLSTLPNFIDLQAGEWDGYRLNKASTLLHSLFLVNVYRADGLECLSMHPLAHAWAKDRLNQEQQQAAWVRAGCILALSKNQSSIWQVYTRQLQPHVQSFLLPHFVKIFSYGPPSTILPILLECGWILNAINEKHRLSLLLEEIHGIFEINLSEPSREQVRILDLTVSNLYQLGEIRSAMQILEQVVEIKQNMLAENHPSLLASQQALARAHQHWLSLELPRQRIVSPSFSEFIDDDDMDLVSVLSLDVPPSLTSGTTLSGASGIAQNAAQQFFEILIKDDIMQPLFLGVIKRAGLEKFKRNFLRLLKKYAIDLKDEAKSRIEVGAARLVRSRANFIVHLIAERMEPNDLPNIPGLPILERDRERDLEIYLQQQVQQTQKYHEPNSSSIDGQSSALNPEERVDEDDEFGQDNELEYDEEVGEPGKPTLSNLEEVKRFMVESEAYKELRASFHHFVFPAEQVTNTESPPTVMIKNAFNTPYRIYWTCTCGHMGYDSFEETIPGAVTKLAHLLQANGIRYFVESEPSDCGTFKLYRPYLVIRNIINRHIKAMGSFFHTVSRPNTSQPVTSMSTGLPGSTNSLPATTSGRPTAKPTNPVTNVVSQSSNIPGIAQTTAAQCQKATLTSRNDYMLLCAYDQRWLATREDLDVTQMKSDRELFNSSQSRMRKRKSQISRVFGLKTVQSISFVKFALRQDQEVDLIEPNEIPPPIEQHYDFNERNPGRIPPIGNDYLMHRFSNSVHCRDSTFCLDQIPKRTGCRPQMGSKPDGFTGWGLYFEESLDMFRFFLWGMAMFLVSLIFGVAWAASKQSVQDGFAVASYILAFEVFTMGTVQAAIAFKMI